MDVQSIETELRTLMIASLEGDAVAYRCLLERLGNHLRAYFNGKLGRFSRGPVESEDLVQEVLMAIHTRRQTYDTSQLFTPWVYAIARYKFIDYLRRNQASINDLPTDDLEEIAIRDDSSQVESTLDLEKLMAGLPPKMRQAIQYVKLDGLSVSEAAARSGMSESNIKVSVHRGLKALALRMSRGKASHED